MERIIKNFFESVVFTLARLLFLIAIPAGVYILCILHTITNMWLGIVMFLLAIFCIICGAWITYLIGLYDIEVYEDSEELIRLRKEKDSE